MPSVTITIADTPSGGVSVYTDFKPAVGNPCSAAQAAALDMIRRTRKEYGLTERIQGHPGPELHSPEASSGDKTVMHVPV